MTCAACQRANLPGGVRCIYCGTPFPAAPEFELPEVAAAAPAAADEPAEPARVSRGGLLGLAAGLVLLLAKGKSLVGLLKRDDICAQLTDDIGGTTGVEAPVGADAFVDVVGGDDQPLGPRLGQAR